MVMEMEEEITLISQYRNHQTSQQQKIISRFYRLENDNKLGFDSF